MEILSCSSPEERKDIEAKRPTRGAWAWMARFMEKLLAQKDMVVSASLLRRQIVPRSRGRLGHVGRILDLPCTDAFG